MDAGIEAALELVSAGIRLAPPLSVTFLGGSEITLAELAMDRRFFRCGGRRATPHLELIEEKMKHWRGRKQQDLEDCNKT